MENDIVNKETIQFIKDVETLRRKGLFKRDAELVSILEWDKSNMSLVLNKHRNVPKEKLKKFANELNNTSQVAEIATKTPTIEELLESKNYVIKLLNDKCAVLEENIVLIKEKLLRCEQARAQR